MRRLAASLASLTALGALAAGAAGPTDIVRVDDYIGAPRALFGRTGAEIERALAAPPAAEAARVASYRDAAVFRATRRLSYPGLVIDVLASGRVRRVRISTPGRGLPFGLDVGTEQMEVEGLLGEPQEAELVLAVAAREAVGKPGAVGRHRARLEGGRLPLAVVGRGHRRLRLGGERRDEEQDGERGQGTSAHGGTSG